jgi:hypothetical protein
VADAKKDQLQEGLIKRITDEHGKHPGFWIKSLSGGGVNWECSCEKSKGQRRKEGA